MIDSKEKKDVRQTQEFLVRQWRAEQYALKMNLPVPVPAKVTVARDSGESREVNQAREGTTSDAYSLKASCGPESHFRGGQTFDKKAYQREYMRKKRADAKS